MAKLNPLKVKQKDESKRIVRQTIAEQLTMASKDLVVACMWLLREKYGFGRKRLMEFYFDFANRLKELQDWYQMPEYDETQWLLRYKLKQETGIDVDELDSMLKFEAVDQRGENI